jgi:uncharacterized protein YjbI with pentapeptide repeats
MRDVREGNPKFRKGFHVTGKKAFFILFVFLVALSITTSGLYAFNPGDLAKLRSTKSCPNCDLSEANLSRQNLYGANLSGANLANTNLTHTNLRDANLSEANVSRANLFKAILFRTNLFKANMSGSNLTAADISNANFVGADLSSSTWTDGRKCQAGSTGICRK